MSNNHQNLINQFYQLRKKILAYRYIDYLIDWDSSIQAPQGCFEVRSQIQEVLSEEVFKLKTSKKTLKLINQLTSIDFDDPYLKKEISLLKKELDFINKIPQDLFVKFQGLLAKTTPIWAKAKNENNFSLFEPYLAQIVEYEKQYISYLETDQLKGYDVLLDLYEEGTNMAFYDHFFDQLKKDLVPFILEKAKKNQEFQSVLNNYHYYLDTQKELSNYLLKVFDFPSDRGIIAESEHPFTSGFGCNDVRVTTHYYPDNFVSSLFSVIHELGHGTYELQCDPKFEMTLLSGGTSMATHESQSRFYENNIGRSYQFWEKHYPYLQSLFPDPLANISLDQFYAEINLVKCSPIRIEADELTYPIHIMIRYEIEKGLFNGSIEVKDLPQVWNQLVKQYLGITITSDTEGVLQDIHWAGGSFGYFPTYALGSAIACQIEARMNQDFDVYQSLSSGDLKNINSWLKTYIHQYGSFKTTQELIAGLYQNNSQENSFDDSEKNQFDPNYYINYLKNKYKDL